MDGVLADVYVQFQKFYKEENGNELPESEMVGKLEAEAYPHGVDYVRKPGFFSTAPTMAGSIGGLNYLNEHYQLLIVSSATEYPDSLKEKLEWLQAFYPFISWKQVIFCGEKKAVKGDIMVDDHPKNLRHFEGKRILFSQPHNLLVDDNSYHRVNNWTELVDLLHVQ